MPAVIEAASGSATTSATRVFELMKRLRSMCDVDYLLCKIAYHAAPTLLGIKPATLVCPDADGRDLGQALEHCVPCLVRDFGVEVARFRNRVGALLILVYQPSLLRSTLAAAEVRELLADAGYDAGGADIEVLLATLRSKCAGQRFPHEIGVFLGYPPRDVRCFMADGGGSRAGCAGCWMAYGDDVVARRRTESFRRAKMRAAELLVGGADIGGVVSGLREELAA